MQEALVETLNDLLARVANVSRAVQYRTAWRRDGGAWRGTNEPHEDRSPLFDVLRSQEAAILSPLRTAVTLRQNDWNDADVWCGFVGGKMELPGLVASLFHCVLDRMDDGEAPVDATISVVADFSSTMERGTLELRGVAPLHGLWLEPDQPDIALPSGVKIVKLSDAEVSSLFPDTGFSLAPHGPMPDYAFTMDFEQEFAMQFTDAIANRENDCAELFENAWLALATFQAGAVSFSTMYVTCLGPAPIPIGRVGRGGRNTSRWGSYRLAREDVVRLQTHARNVDANRSPELEIAVRRLAESESRTSGVDAFLDAMIGLETLLVPGAPSVSFKFALNYALLDLDANERHRRYSLAKRLYSFRSKVVHAGDAGPYALGESKLTGHEIAERARAMLRETVRYFLSLDKTPASQKEWGDFWQAKYFGSPSTSPK